MSSNKVRAFSLLQNMRPTLSLEAFWRVCELILEPESFVRHCLRSVFSKARGSISSQVLLLDTPPLRMVRKKKKLQDEVGGGKEKRENVSWIANESRAYTKLKKVINGNCSTVVYYLDCCLSYFLMVINLSSKDLYCTFERRKWGFLFLSCIMCILGMGLLVWYAQI